MILHTLPTKLTMSGDVALPRHARLPLGLSQNSKIWALYRRRSHDFDQVMFSPYPSDRWSDLWRLEIQMDDASGQLLELVEILDACDIRILHMVARNAFSSNYHFKYLMLDCTRYVSPIDGDMTKRKKGEVGLSGLKDLLYLTFSKVLRVSVEGEPRIRMERNLVHWNMSQALDAKRMGDDEIFGPIEIDMIKNTVPLVEIKKLSGPGRRTSANYAVMSTNTKSHVIYCKLMNDNERVAHIVIFFEGKGNVFKQVLQCIKDANLNIVRSQLKQGFLSSMEPTDEEAKAWRRPYTLNVQVQETRRFEHGTIVTSLEQALNCHPSLSEFMRVKPCKIFDPEA